MNTNHDTYNILQPTNIEGSAGELAKHSSTSANGMPTQLGMAPQLGDRPKFQLIPSQDAFQDWHPSISLERNIPRNLWSSLHFRVGIFSRNHGNIQPLQENCILEFQEGLNILGKLSLAFTLSTWKLHVFVDNRDMSSFQSYWHLFVIMRSAHKCMTENSTRTVLHVLWHGAQIMCWVR